MGLSGGFRILFICGVTAISTAVSGCNREVSVKEVPLSDDPTLSSVRGLTVTTGIPVQVFVKDPFLDSANANLTFGDNLQPYTTRRWETRLTTTSSILLNDWLKVASDGTFSTQLASPKDSLEYVVTDPRFAQVNAFYHANRLLDRAINLGQSLTDYGPIVIDAHCNQANNAYFDPANKKVCLGYSQPSGQNKVWASLDTDVITHEFNHSLNHFLSTDEIMNSSYEAGAMDEGLSDYWANVTSGSPELSYWFGTAISRSSGSLSQGSRGPLRNAVNSLTYPRSLEAEIHADGQIWSAALWGIRSSLASALQLTFDKLVHRVVRSLQMGDGFKEATFYLREQGPALGISLSMMDSVLQDKGLIREDDLSSVAAADTTPVLVIDDHVLDIYNYQASGNCNATLDIGERAMVLFNLKSPDTELGAISATLTKANAADSIKVIVGGDTASYLRIGSGSHFLASLPGGVNDLNTVSASKLQSGRGLAVFGASFVIDATAATSGRHDFNLVLTSRSSRTGALSRKTINVSLTVGNAATKTGCSPSTGVRLWP